MSTPAANPVVVGVRHGEVLNPGGVIYAGLPGFGLSDLGREQAQRVGEALGRAPVAAIYTSPLDRAVETANRIAEIVDAPVVEDQRLEEWRHWQQWAGLTWDELREQGRDAWEAYTSDPGSVTAGESLEQLADRFHGWLSDVRAAHEGVVVGVSHLEPLRAILLRLRARPAKELFDIQVGLGEAVRIWPDPEPVPLGPHELADLSRPSM